MNRMIYLAFILLLVLLLFTSCTNAIVENIYYRNDKNIAVDVGKTFTIQLEENPTAGYMWSFSIADESIIKLNKDFFDKSPCKPVAIGSGGLRTLRFTGISKGTTNITFVYEQSWEKKPDDDILVYTVIVK